MKKIVAILSAVIAFAVSSTAFVGYASPEIPEDATVKTLDTALANPSQWTFNEGTTAAVSDGKLSLNQAVGTAYANPNSNLSATELTQFKWTPQFEAGGSTQFILRSTIPDSVPDLVKTQADFVFRLGDPALHTGVQFQYYGFLVAAGDGTTQNIWFI